MWGVGLSAANASLYHGKSTKKLVHAKSFNAFYCYVFVLCVLVCLAFVCHVALTDGVELKCVVLRYDCNELKIIGLYGCAVR